MKVDQMDVMWLAGYLEGEGTFHAAGSKRDDGMYPTLCIQVTSTDLDVLQRVGRMIEREANAVKSYQYEKSIKSSNLKQQYRVRVYGHDALQLMSILHPLMGERRQDQIKQALNLCYRLSDLAKELAPSR